MAKRDPSDSSYVLLLISVVVRDFRSMGLISAAKMLRRQIKGMVGVPRTATALAATNNTMTTPQQSSMHASFF